MARIKLLDEPQNVLFEGFLPPTNFVQGIEDSLSALPLITLGKLNKICRKEKKYYHIYKRLSIMEARAMLYDSVMEYLEFAREDGELNFQCSCADDPFFLILLTGYQMLGEETGWLLAAHSAASTIEGFTVLLPKD